MARSVTRYFQQSRAEKEHHPRISRRTELPENGQAQHVPVETAAPAQVSRPQQNPAAQYLHATILTDSAVTPGAPSPAHFCRDVYRSPAGRHACRTGESARRHARRRCGSQPLGIGDRLGELRYPKLRYVPGLRPDGARQSVAEQLGRVGAGSCLVPDNARGGPGRCGSVQDVIGGGLLAGKAKILGKDDADSGEELTSADCAGPS